MVETFSIYTKGHVLLSKGGGHVDKELDVLSDTTTEDGIRTLVIKPADVSKAQSEISELVELIAERLGEKESKHFKEILRDSLKDCRNSDITRMLKKVRVGKEPIKAHKGCYRVLIGDGRSKNSDFIRIRD